VRPIPVAALESPSEPFRVNDLLQHPAVQAVAIPFVVAALLALALAGTRYLALAVVSGVVVVLSLTIGFSLEPLTSARKMVLAILAAAGLAVALEAAGVAARRAVVAAVSLAAGAAAVWAVSRVLAQIESPIVAWSAGAGAALLALATTGSATLSGATSSLRGAVIGACLGFGSGVLALLGASAMLSQIGLAAGAASAAVALVQMLRGREAPLGWTVVLPAAVAASIVGILATATGELRWTALLPLPFVPLVAHLVPAGALRRPWQMALATGVAGLVPVAVAVGLAWMSAAASAPAG